MAFNRDRFQAAKLEVNKKITDEVEKTFKTFSTRGDYHSIDKGKNYFRMMPPHNPDEPSMQAKVVYWLDCKVEEIKDGEPTGKYVIKPRPIFDSRIHGGTPKDIIDEYIKFTKKKIFETVQDKEEKTKLLAPINGWRDRTGKWNPGILPSQSFVCYATKGDIVPENLGRLELWKNDKETLEKLNISENSDEPIITDMFSDPNEGIKFIITKNLDDKGQIYTLITKDTFDPKGVKDVSKAYQQWLNSQKVPDEVLAKLEEMEPLSKQFKNVYKKSDFNRALEALEMFDEKHGYGIFKFPEFLSIVKEIEAYYPDTETEKDSHSSYTPFDLNDMTRAELKQYIKDKNLPIRIVGSMSEDVIREMIYEIENEPVKDCDEEDEISTKSSNKTSIEFSDETNIESSDETSVENLFKERLAKLKLQR